MTLRNAAARIGSDTKGRFRPQVSTGKRPVQGDAVHAEKVGDMTAGLAVVYEFAGVIC